MKIIFKRYEEALILYNELLDNDLENAVLLTEKGLILNNLNRFKEAEEVLRKAVRLEPESGNACSALCWCLTGLEKYEEALEFGNQAVLHRPHDWGPWNNRSLAKYGIGNFEDAVNDFRQAIRCMPSEKIGRLGLLTSLMELDKVDVPDVYGDLLVRFGETRFPGNVNEDDNGKGFGSSRERRGTPEIVAGYIDGYW